MLNNMEDYGSKDSALDTPANEERHEGWCVSTNKHPTRFIAQPYTKWTGLSVNARSEELGAFAQ